MLFSLQLLRHVAYSHSQSWLIHLDFCVPMSCFAVVHGWLTCPWPVHDTSHQAPGAPGAHLFLLSPWRKMFWQKRLSKADMKYPRTMWPSYLLCSPQHTNWFGKGCHGSLIIEWIIFSSVKYLLQVDIAWELKSGYKSRVKNTVLKEKQIILL